MKLTLFYENNEAYMREFLKAMLKKTRYIAFLVGIIGLIIGLLAYRDGSLIQAGILLASGAIALLTGLLLLPLTLRDFKRHDRKITGGESQVMLRFFDDRAELHQGEAHLEIRYEYLEKIFTTETLYIFKLDKGSGFYLPKTALGEKADAFHQLLEGPLKNFIKS